MVQLILSGDADPADIRTPLLRAIEQLSQVFRDADSTQYLREATEMALDGEYYQALKSLRALLPREARLMAAQKV